MNFAEWFAAGFTDLIPIIPPGAELNPFSKVKPGQRGKVPGRKRPDGTWTGMKAWIEHPTSAQDCAEWDTWYEANPSIGLRAGHYPAIDIDVEDEELAGAVRDLAWAHLGPAPARVREGSHKLLLLYRTVLPFKRLRLWFTFSGAPHLVEVLGSGNQFLIQGDHKDGDDYDWAAPVVLKDLIGVSAEGVRDFLLEVQKKLATLGCEGFRLEGTTATSATERPSVPQPDLEAIGGVASVRRLLEAMPNSPEAFPSRDDYLKVGYAVKASLPHDETEALDLWLAWAEPYPTFDREVAVGDWHRLQPPFTLGWDYLQRVAGEHGAPVVEEQFADICDPPPLNPPSPVDVDSSVTYSDAWVASLFLAKHGHEVRYCERLGGWLRWEGSRWRVDTENLVAAWVAQSCRWAGRHALDHMEKPGLVAKECASNAKRKNVQAYASIDPRINVPVEAFDADPWALNTPGGIVDLRTGALLPADPGRLFTRCTAVAPKATPTPRWSQFLQEITRDDDETAAYLKRLAGYSLTGSTREHVLAFLWGPGGNGKGVFLNTLVRALGSYAAVAAMDTFTSSRFDRHPAELAALVGARLVTAQETQEDRSWDEAKVKSITGGDPITARFMRQDFFTYQPQFKLLFAGNHRPHVKNLDDAMRRRFHLVPFTSKPKVPDQVLAERLQHEWAGILQWAIDGCLAWQEQGLNPPAVVLEATENYFVDEDPVGRWMSERTQRAGLEDAGTDTQELFNDWRRWCLDQNEKPGSERQFVQSLLAKGLEKWRNPSSRRRGLSGVLLKGDMEALPPPDPGGARFIH